MVDNITNNAKENTKVFCTGRDEFSLRPFMLKFALKPARAKLNYKHSEDIFINNLPGT